MQYDSAHDGKIFQTHPLFFPSQSSQHKPKGWTESEAGYINEAKQWAMCVWRNRKLMKRPYTWAVHINLNEEFPVDQISPMWQKVSSTLRKAGIVALWVREPNRLNKLHYHIIVKNQITEKALKNAIEDAMPSRSLVQWRKRVEPVKNEWRLCRYIFKAKVQGYNKKGVLVKDLYRSKRLLFKAKMPFKKVGFIGDFWEQGKNKKKLWDDIKDIEKRIAEGLERPNVKRLCKYVYELLGETVPLKQIERSYGHDDNSRAVSNWIETLLAGQWAEEKATMTDDAPY